MKIKCKIDCQVVDCEDCAKKKEEIENTIQEIKYDIMVNEDKEVLFDHLLSMMFIQEHHPELINLCKARLRELGVTLPKEEEKKSVPSAATVGDWSC